MSKSMEESDVCTLNHMIQSESWEMYLKHGRASLALGSVSDKSRCFTMGCESPVTRTIRDESRRIRVNKMHLTDCLTSYCHVTL